MYRLAAYVPLFLISFLWSVSCYAIPITGTAVNSNLNGSGQAGFNLSGSGFTAFSNTTFPGQILPSCLVGAICNVTVTIPANFSNSFGSLNGVSASSLNGSLVFSASFFPQNTGDVTVPMNMSGSLTGQQGGLVVWTVWLVGTGTMILSSGPPLSGGAVNYFSQNMSFSGATVVPEPSSWQISLIILLPLTAYSARRRRPNKESRHV